MTTLLVKQVDSDWIVCLGCFHVRHVPIKNRVMLCPQCQSVRFIKRLTLADVTHSLRRQIPRAMKQLLAKLHVPADQKSHILQLQRRKNFGRLQ